MNVELSNNLHYLNNQTNNFLATKIAVFGFRLVLVNNKNHDSDIYNSNSQELLYDSTKLLWNSKENKQARAF